MGVDKSQVATEAAATSTDDGHPVIHRTAVGGTTVLWSDAPGPLTGTLLFRVGRADESLKTLGASHLIEHLVLPPVAGRTAPQNGWVEDVITGFAISGDRQDLVSFFSQVTRALGDLPLERLELERRILTAERATRESHIYSRAMELRFGAAGYGLVNWYEFGVDWLSGEELQSWARERFTRTNALLWLSGAPPETLELHLGGGTEMPPPAPDPIPGLGLPSEVESGTGGVALTMIAPRSSALHAGFAILRERALAGLRDDKGLSYAPDSDYRPLDGRIAHLLLTADCRDPDAAQVRGLLVEMLDSLASDGPTAEELAWDRTMFERAITDTRDPMGRLDWHARELLLGVDPPTTAQLIEERDALTSKTVADAMASAAQSLLVVIPAGAGATRGRSIPEYTTQHFEVTSGTRYRPTEEWRRFKMESELVIGADGISYSAGKKENPVNLDFAGCVAGVRLPSGGLRIIGRDGSWIVIHAGRYQRGSEALARLEGALGSERLIPLSEAEENAVALIRRHLGASEISRLDREIDLIPSAIGDSEQLRCVAEASRGDQVGLLAVTGERLMFVFCGAGGTEFYEAHFGDETLVQTKGFVSKKLVVVHKGEATTFTDIRPAGRLQDVLNSVPR